MFLGSLGGGSRLGGALRGRGGVLGGLCGRRVGLFWLPLWVVGRVNWCWWLL